MDLEELHARVRGFVAERDWARYHSPRNLAMALSVEAAELLEVYLWTADDAPPTPERTLEAADEAADVMICLLNLCDRAGIDLGAAVVAKLAKAAEKYPADQVRGRSLKYDQYPSWDGERHRHHLDPALAPADLPEEALRVLVDRGLPAVGSRFVSGIADGRLRAIEGGYVVGSSAGAELVLQVPGGEVVLVDGDGRIRAASPSLRAFVDTIEAYLAGDPAVPPDDPDGFWASWRAPIAG